VSGGTLGYHLTVVCPLTLPEELVLPHKLKAIAYHEAGHAVMSWCESVAVRGISILPADDIDAFDSLPDTGSHCHLDIRQKPQSRSRMEKLARVCLAGPLAQRRYKPRSHWRADGDHDFASAADLIGIFTGSDRETEAYLSLLEIQTQQELEHENVWMRVEALASTLLEKTQLTARKIRAILKDPPVSAQRLEQIMKYAMPIPFANVSRIEIDLAEIGPATNFTERSRGFVWPQTYVDSIQCSNAPFCAGHLDLTALVTDMVENHQIEQTVDQPCTGNDESGPCSTRFTGIIGLTFID